MARTNPDLLPINQAVSPEKPCICGATEGCKIDPVGGDIGCLHSGGKKLKGFNYVGKNSEGLHCYSKPLGQKPTKPKPTKTKPKTTPTLPADDDGGGLPCGLLRIEERITRFMGHRLRFNTLAGQVELDGEPLSPDRIKIRVARALNIQAAREDLWEIISDLAEQDSYSPVVEYLERVEATADRIDIHNLAHRYLGSENPLHQKYVHRWLIGAIARAMQPGCKLDTALVLQGNQGYRKSTFFRVLSCGWFDDSLGNASDKDERLKLHRSWFVEWGELESIFKRRDVAATKAFLACQVDLIRPPYGRSFQEFRRPSIICGSTNQDAFLNDETGNRRFWVVPVANEIDTELLTQERDGIWAAAMDYYRMGEPWWLLPHEQEHQKADTAEYESTDPWEEAIEDYLTFQACATVPEILDKALHIELARQGKPEEMRVSKILKRLGWEARRQYLNGKRKRVWYPSESKDLSLEVVPVVPEEDRGGTMPDLEPKTERDNLMGQPGQPNLEVVPAMGQPTPPEVVPGKSPTHRGIQPPWDNQDNQDSPKPKKGFFQVGDQVRYVGENPGRKQVCGGKRLTIERVEIGGDGHTYCLVNHPRWRVGGHLIDSGELELCR